MRERISVIVPSYNSHATIARTLESLLAQQGGPPGEILVADSSDDDRTVRILEDFAARGVRLLRLRSPRTIPALARNAAARAARGDLLAFIDSDATAAPDWLTNLERIWREGCRVGGGAILLPDPQRANPVAAAQYFLQFNEFMPSGRRRPKSFVPSCNFFCEKALFEQAGGFPDIRASEDVLFGIAVRRHHTPLVFDPSLRVHHIFREDREAYLRNQRLLGEYILIYRRQRGSRLLSGRAAAALLVPLILALKFARITWRVLPAGGGRWAALYLRSLPQFVPGLLAWGGGFLSAAGGRSVPSPERVRVLGAMVDNVTLSETLTRVEALVNEGHPSLVITPNVDHLVRLEKDPVFAETYRAARLVLADGVPLLWAARFLGTPLKAKVSGSDLFPELCRLAAGKGWPVFFLGGRPGAAARAAEVLTARYPGLRVVGTECPAVGFDKKPEENRRLVEAIRSSGARIVFVGLGSPKQELWIHRHQDEYGAPVSIGVGVSFEFVAGMVKRAPAWMQRAGLEWSWRLFMEPKRLWKRYLLDDPVFFYLVLKQKLARPAAVGGGP